MADDINKLQEEIKQREQNLGDIEKEYTTNRESLLRLGKEYFKTTILSLDQTKQNVAILKKLNTTLKKLNESDKALDKATDEVLKSQRKRIEAERKEIESLKQQAEERKKSSWAYRLGFREPDKDDLATQYRARQMAGGIESIMEGRFASGTRQILSTVPKIANFMGGPYFLAIQAVTSGLLKLDEALAKTHQQVLAGTGGVFSPFRNDRYASVIFQKQITEDLKKYGLQGKSAEVLAAAFSSTGIGGISNERGEILPDELRKRVKSQGAAIRELGSLGISEDTINQLFKISRNLEGKSETQALASQLRLANLFKSSRYMTEQEGAQQSLSLYEQTKNLGVNFEWASRAVAKFDRALQLGEVSLNDFAAVTRGIKGADTGRAAGVAAMLKEYAMRNNIELPKEFMQASDVGAGFYLTTREGIGNKKIQQALVGMAKEQGSNINFGSSILDQAAAMQLYLGKGPYGANISSDMMLKTLKSGDWSDITGGRYGVKEDEASKQAQELMKDAENFYKDNRSYMTAIKEAIGTAANTIVAGYMSTQRDDSTWSRIITNALISNPVTMQIGIGILGKKGSDVLSESATQQPTSD